MRSKEGETHLKALREMLAGKTIVDIEFSNDVQRVSTTFHLSDGKTFVANSPSLELDALRTEFEDAIQREYYKDYPERKP
jgi:hypothetical protein